MTNVEQFLAVSNAHSPAFAADGDRFAFTTNRRSGHASDVFVYSIDGKSRCFHQTDGWFDVAGWGPNDDRFLLVEARSNVRQNLHVLDFQTGERR